MVPWGPHNAWVWDTFGEGMNIMCQVLCLVAFLLYIIRFLKPPQGSNTMQQGAMGWLTSDHVEIQLKKRSREKTFEQELGGCKSRIWARDKSHPELLAGLDAPQSDRHICHPITSALTPGGLLGHWWAGPSRERTWAPESIGKDWSIRLITVKLRMRHGHFLVPFQRGNQYQPWELYEFLEPTGLSKRDYLNTSVFLKVRRIFPKHEGLLTLHLEQQGRRRWWTGAGY